MTVVDASTLSAAELVALVEADHLQVDVGCDLLDSDSVFIEDISADVVASGSSVELGVYNTIHRTCTLNVSRELQWGSQRVKPYMLLSEGIGRPAYYERLTDEDGAPLTTEDGEPLFGDLVAAVEPTFYRFPLGVFVLTTPELAVGDDTPTFSVQGYDLLQVLDTPYGRTYTLEAGGAVIAAVEALITAAGETSSIDQTAAATVAAGTMSYNVLDTEDWSTLRICNDLLESIGYRALYADAQGVFRSEPYRSPADLPVVWSYNADSSTTTVGEWRTSLADYFNAANVVIGVNDDPEAAAVPVEGAGIYTLQNAADGPTSIAERGREIRRVIRGTFADQAALETAVTAALDVEKRVTAMVEVTVSPNPIHSHFDVVNYRDDSLAVNGRYLVQSWSLPLDGSDMSLTLRAV